MGLSTERKVFLGLFLVAGGALVFDQAILGPSDAGAAMVNIGLDLEDIPIESAAQPVLAKLETSAADLLNERLAGFIEDGNKPDPSLIGLFGNLSTVQPSATSVETSSGAQDPSDLPRLSAVMPSSTGGAAVLDGKMVRAGELSAQGYRLISVQRRAILLEKNGTSYTIEVPVNGG